MSKTLLETMIANVKAELDLAKLSGNKEREIHLRKVLAMHEGKCVKCGGELKDGVCRMCGHE